jgi:cytoskeleton protein RodZ
MASENPGQELRIGNALKEARRRAGLDIRTVEDRTKIRTRYLRALESEDWGVLPGHAYVKGFLRTYANLLGLDGEALVDEYRRQVEGPQASPVPLSEGVLQRRRLREPGEFPAGPPSRLWILGGVVVVITGVLLVLGLTGGDDGRDRGSKADRKERRQDQEQRGEEQRAAGEEAVEAAPETVSLRLVANTDGLQVCLLGDTSRQPLIDGFAGSAGSEDVFEARRFQLRFPFGYDLGQFDLFVGGKRVRLQELQGPVAYSIEPPREVRQVDPPGTSCP